MPLEQLPEELLLRIAQYLAEPRPSRHLRNLCLSSRQLRPIAQEALFKKANLTRSCGCHPMVNPLIKLLRTLLDRPDLAAKVRTLRLQAVRKRVEHLYAQNGFELGVIRDRAILKLEELGYRSTHPWWRSINNFIESAFGGLLLALLPNLTNVNLWIKDHQRGAPSSECISALWGGTIPPEAVLSGWKNVKHLITADTSMLKCGVQLESLTALDLRTVSIGTVLRLNGPGSLQGAENIESLALTVSIQFGDRSLVENADIAFSDLLDALGCHKLRGLQIVFINDGYSAVDEITTELSATYFLGQLRSVESTLHGLDIAIETTEEDGQLDWLVDMCQDPIKSMKNFSSLKTLAVPQAFLFNAYSTSFSPDNSCMPKDLPPNLQDLELLWPHEGVEEWVEGFLRHNNDEASDSHSGDISQAPCNSFQTLTLRCDDEAGIAAPYFTDIVDEVWWNLYTERGIKTEVADRLRPPPNFVLPELYKQQNLIEEDSDFEEDEDKFMSCQGGLPDFSLHYGSQTIRDRTNVLAYLRENYHEPNGFTIEDIASRLAMDSSEVATAVSVLIEHGNIGGFIGPGQRYYVRFFKSSISLIRRDITENVIAEETEREDQDEGNSSNPQQEGTHDESMGSSKSLPMKVSACRIAILKALRDHPVRPAGLTVSEIHTIFGQRGHTVIRTAIQDLFCGGFINSDGILPGSNASPSLTFHRCSRELREHEADMRIKAINALERNADEYYESDSGTDEDMPDLESITPAVDTAIGPPVAPLSRLGLVTETAVLRFVRHCGPLRGVTCGEIASRLGTNLDEVLLRVSLLVPKGHVREVNDRIYFVSENEELLGEDMN